MRVYDIALMYVRAVAAIDVVRAIIDLPFVAVTALERVTLLHLNPRRAADASSAVIGGALLSPVASIVIAIVLLVLAKPIARFAAKFAATSDAASQF